MNEYIFNEWKPNPWFLIISLAIYVYIVIISSLYITILIGIMLILFGWSNSFSKRISKRNDKTSAKDE